MKKYQFILLCLLAAVVSGKAQQLQTSSMYDLQEFIIIPLRRVHRVLILSGLPIVHSGADSAEVQKRQRYSVRLNCRSKNWPWRLYLPG